MICNNKYLYKIELVTAADVLEFVRIATKCGYPVTLVNGNRRLNAKSIAKGLKQIKSPLRKCLK